MILIAQQKFAASKSNNQLMLALNRVVLWPDHANPTGLKKDGYIQLTTRILEFILSCYLWKNFRSIILCWDENGINAAQVIKSSMGIINFIIVFITAYALIMVFFTVSIASLSGMVLEITLYH